MGGLGRASTDVEVGISRWAKTTLEVATTAPPTSSEYTYLTPAHVLAFLLTLTASVRFFCHPPSLVLWRTEVAHRRARSCGIFLLSFSCSLTRMMVESHVNPERFE